MSDSIRYVGPPTLTAAGVDIVAFHLHRYLAIWIRRNGQPRVMVTLGHERTACASATIAVSAGQARAVEVNWSFDDLEHTCVFGACKLRLEQGDSEVVYDVIPIFERPPQAAPGAERPPAPGVRAGVIAYALLLGAQRYGAEALGELQLQIAEAVGAARRNALRLFFDDNKDLGVKPFLYRLMDHLPEWCGCDHAASFILTSNLDAMTLEDSDRASFAVVAERLFLEPGADEGADEGAGRDAGASAGLERADRLVGMALSLGDRWSAIVRHAVEHQRLEPRTAFHVFVRDEGSELWRSVGDEDGAGEGARFESFHALQRGTGEHTYVFVPLIAREERETELLGFLTLAYRSPRELTTSVAALLTEMADRLSAHLRFSPLYTLRARKLWILNQARRALERALNAPGDTAARVEALIADVTAHVARDVDVPSFAIGYLVRRDEGDDEGGATDEKGARRYLRYVHPHGWSHFEQLELAVDVSPEQRIDSGVSTLAIRLERPLVLAGGHGEGEALAFKNYLYVNEDTAEVIDARSPRGRAIEEQPEAWGRLGDYYTPARETAYATLAFPIIFAGQALGVVTIEVERHTNWLWWTGFGGRLFWALLAAELAYALKALGVLAPEDRPG